MWRWLKASGLLDAYRENSTFYMWCRRVLSVPHLPKDQIQPAYKELCAETVIFDSDREAKTFVEFKAYLRTTWFSKPGTLSAWGRSSCTNNGAESWHSRVKALNHTAKPNPWKFAKTLNSLLETGDNM